MHIGERPVRKMLSFMVAMGDDQSGDGVAREWLNAVWAGADCTSRVEALLEGLAYCGGAHYSRVERITRWMLTALAELGVPDQVRTDRDLLWCALLRYHQQQSMDEPSGIVVGVQQIMIAGQRLLDGLKCAG